MPFEGSLDATTQKSLPILTGVSFSVDNQPVRVYLQDVNRIFNDIDKYNAQFSMGAMMGRMFISQIKSHESIESQSPVDSLTEEHENQQISAFFLISTHKQTLHDIGLTLEPIGGAPLMGGGTEANEGKMAINVSSRDKFISFLHAIQPAQADATRIRFNLEKIPVLLSQQIMARYNLLMPEPEALELFEGMEQIITEYKRLGMTGAISQLENYYNHGKIGDLGEYISIERRGLFTQPGKGFGPADWETDATPDYIEAQWNEAIAILDMVKQNPKADGLYTQLYEHLRMCVDVALEKLSTLGNIPADTKQKDQTILEVAKQKLGQFAQNNPSN
jgi:hypothetical protein